MLRRTTITVYLTFYLTLVVFSLLLQPAAGGIHLSKSIGDFKIKSHGFLTNGGLYYICGEIENNSTKNYTDIVLNYTFYDSKGNIIFYDESPISLKWRPLLSQGISPFSYVLENETIARKVSRYDIGIKNYTEIEKEDIPPFGLKITHYNLQGNTLVGSIRNLAPVNATFVIVYAIFYYENGSVMVTGASQFFLKILPNETKNFIIEFPSSLSNSLNISEVGSYSLIPDARYPAWSTQQHQENEQEQIPWWNDPIIMTFIIVVVFSALVLIVVYLVAKFGRWRKKRYLRRVKRRYYKTKT